MNCPEPVARIVLKLIRWSLLYVRMAGRDPDVLGRYADEGFEHVTVWANQLWPADGAPAEKRERFLEASAALLRT